MKLTKLLKELKVGDDEFVDLTAKDVESEVKSVLGDMVVDVYDRRGSNLVTIKFKSNDDMRKFIKNSDKFSTKIEKKIKRKVGLRDIDDLAMAGITRGKSELSFSFSYIKP